MFLEKNSFDFANFLPERGPYGPSNVCQVWIHFPENHMHSKVVIFPLIIFSDFLHGVRDP